MLLTWITKESARKSLARQCGELRPEPMQGQKHWELALELDRAITLLSPSRPRLEI